MVKDGLEGEKMNPGHVAECSGPQYDILEPKKTLPHASGLNDPKEGLRFVVCGNSEEHQNPWSQIFQSFHRAGVHVGIHAAQFNFRPMVQESAHMGDKQLTAPV